MEGLKDSVTFDFVTPLSEKWCTRFDSDVQLQRSGKSSFVPLVLRARRIEEEIEMWCVTEDRGYWSGDDGTGSIVEAWKLISE